MDEKSYLLDEDDFFINKSGAQANCDYKGYKLSISCHRALVLNKQKDYIPYEPGMVARATLAHTMFAMATGSLNFVASQLIKDEYGVQLDDRFELTLEQTWNFTDELSLNLRLLNLLDNKLNKLPLYPERGPQVYAGVKWYF